jgi:hypothetical protein
MLAKVNVSDRVGERSTSNRVTFLAEGLCTEKRAFRRNLDCCAQCLCSRMTWARY